MNKLSDEKIYEASNRKLNNDIIAENNNNNICDIFFLEMKLTKLENNNKNPIIRENIENNNNQENAIIKTEIIDLIKSNTSRDNEKKKIQYTDSLKIKSEKVSIVKELNNNDNNPKNNFKKINEGEEPLPSLNINSLLKIQVNKGII